MKVLPELGIGIDLGGTQAKGVLVTQDGVVRRQVVMPFDGGEAASWKAAVEAIAIELRTAAAGQPYTLGLSAPGLPDAHNTCIRWMPGRLEGLEGLVWAELLGEDRVPVINDAHAALMAEHQFGAGKGCRHLVLLTLGTGVGGGLLIEGQLFQGMGNRAGHLGHTSLDHQGITGITGLPGTLEEAFGNESVSRRTSGRFQTTLALVQAYLEGDTFGTWCWLDSVRKLAIGIAGFCNTFSPEKIILSGGIAQAGEALLRPLQTFLDVYEWRPGGLQVPVTIAHFQEYAGALGAAAYGMRA
ncbi:MAG: ROK family protein [Bacteroidia bacterium]|nr:ROK family protein [Bacteroidia bacterium]